MQWAVKSRKILLALQSATVQICDLPSEPGWSKDAKFKESRVLLALFVTSGGLPLGYELMRGSTSEVTSLIPAVRALKERMDLRHAVCVADRGMMLTTSHS